MRDTMIRWTKLDLPHFPDANVYPANRTVEEIVARLKGRLPTAVGLKPDKDVVLDFVIVPLARDVAPVMADYCPDEEHTLLHVCPDGFGIVVCPSNPEERLRAVFQDEFPFAAVLAAFYSRLHLTWVELDGEAHGASEDEAD